jgi:hypothetical protein
MGALMKLIFLFLAIFGQLALAEEKISQDDVFLDKKTGKYLRICGQEGDTLIVKEACGKYWDKIPRTRDQLAKQLTEYKNLKRGSVVMMKVKKSDGEIYWILGAVSFMYENGRVDVMEYYDKRFGFTVGTQTWPMDYTNISTGKTNESKSMCAKEDFEISYDYDNGRKFIFKKGDQVTMNQVFDNGFASITLTSKVDNFFRYGLNNQLPVSMDKLVQCESDTPSVSNANVSDEARKAKDRVDTTQGAENTSSTGQSR